MTKLVRVADAAYPFDLAQLAGLDVFAVAGYAGGDTPHAWSPAEIQAVIASNREWWPIWTAPSTGQVLSAAGGAGAAFAMKTRLNILRISTDTPVLLDIENGTWNASPAGARAYLDAWKSGMRSWGFRNPFGYLPWVAQFDWVANWTNKSPSVLPPNVIGWQYASDGQLGKPFDLSIFDLDKLTNGGDDLSLTDEQDKRLTHVEALVMLINAGMGNISPAIAEMRGEDQVMFRAVAVTAAREAGLLAAIQQLGMGAVAVDLTAIQQAAEQGAQAALSGYRLSLTKDQG